ncbi:MAG: universal stress protein [Flavobacteriaceae bacterium]|nr:universal stress protein [Flavobacteriaceae bacterium]
MKNILVPTDFSDNSWNAIEYALSFFKDTISNFYLLHVTALSNYVGGEPVLVPAIDTIEVTLVKEARTKLLNLVKKIKLNPLSANHNFITITSSDYFVDAIRKQIIEKKIDLVVMGTKGASGLKQVIIGSNTGDLITKVKCPVLVVPEKANFRAPKEIAFPTDFNLFYHTRILKNITEVSHMFDASIRILHVAKKDEVLTAFQQENKDYLHDFFMDEKHSFHKITNKKIDAGVQCFVESRDIDLIIMIAKNLNLFQQILFKPAVEEISYHTDIPFLVLHELN